MIAPSRLFLIPRTRFPGLLWIIAAGFLLLSQSQGAQIESWPFPTTPIGRRTVRSLGWISNNGTAFPPT